MSNDNRTSLFSKLRNAVIGKPRSPYESSLFAKLSLVAFFAWVGLGADGMSSSCYGPQEAFLALNGHTYLSLFVALATAFTILVISASYSQIVELFPTGGGGYLVASKLLSRDLGVVSGCALLIDYVLTITVSVASGADAIFSFLPAGLYRFKLEFAVVIVVLLILLNLRGVKESVMTLIPIFLIFVATHLFFLIYGIGTNFGNFTGLFASTKSDLTGAYSEIGLFGIILIIMRAYSMGAGTYTGIEAVSNGLPVLREPKVETAKRTMRYMALSLTFLVVGLMIAYLIYGVVHVPGKTLNAVLFEAITQKWGGWGSFFVLLTLLSEAALLFVAAQTGFIGGPMVLANMAVDKWFPSRFKMLSDRFVNHNGILIMGISALVIMILAKGLVSVLIVLYSINVFITFSLSQLGMVIHWWDSRSQNKHWKKKIFVNGIGLVLTAFILLSMVIIKFNEGGWITLLLTGVLVLFAQTIKRHYYNTARLLYRLNSLVVAAGLSGTAEEEEKPVPNPATEFNSSDKTAVLFVNGFNGLGLHSLFAVVRLFEGIFKNFIFVEVGVIDSGNFKGAEEMYNLENQVQKDLNRYISYTRKQGYHSDSIYLIGTEVMSEIEKIVPNIVEKFPNVVFFGGQLVFPEDSYVSRWLHNNTVFALQRKFYSHGIPFVLLPIRV